MTHRFLRFIVLSTALAAPGCMALTPGLSARMPGAREADQTLVNIARLNENQGRLREAQRQYQQVLRRQPDHFEAWHRLSLVHTQLEEHEAAQHAFQQALALRPHHPDLLADWGYALFLWDDAAGAEAALRQALQGSPGHRRAANNLAIVLAHQQRWDESFELFRQAVGEAEAHANMGYYLVQAGNGPQAIEHYSRALTLDPQLPAASQALWQLGELQQRLERTQPPEQPAAVALQEQP